MTNQQYYPHDPQQPHVVYYENNTAEKLAGYDIALYFIAPILAAILAFF